MIEILETFEKKEKESFFHGIDWRKMEMADYLEAVKRKMSSHTVPESSMRKLRDLAVDAGFLYSFCGIGKDTDAVFQEMATEKIQEMLAVAGMEEKTGETHTDPGKAGKQLASLCALTPEQTPGNPVLKRLIEEKARKHILGTLLKDWTDESCSFTSACRCQKYDRFCLADIRDSGILSDDEMDELFALAGKGLGFFDGTGYQYLHDILASRYLNDGEALRFAALLRKAKRKAKTAGADSGEIEFMSGEDFLKELEQRNSAEGHSRKIISFKLPAVVDSTGIPDADASRFTGLLMKSGVKPRDDVFSVDEILEKLDEEERQEFTAILYASQEYGTVIPGKRENLYPYDWTMEAPEVNYDDGSNTVPVKEDVPNHIDIQQILASGKISEKEMIRFLTLVTKAEACSQDALVVIGSGNLTDAEKDELRSIIGESLGIDPSKICPAPIPHTSVREGKRFAMLITSEDEFYPNELTYYSDHPEEGILEDIVYGDNYEELTCNGEYEGLFYILYDLRTGRKISGGIVDPDGLTEEIEEAIG